MPDDVNLHSSRDPWSGMRPADFESLAQTYGTPFYLYDADEVISRIDGVRRCLGGVHVYYAVKANPNLGLLKAVRGSADGLDISSAGELEQALLAGYAPAQLSFAGPAKTTAELAEAIRHGVGCVSIESPRELSECIAIARAASTPANVALRVNPEHVNRAFGIKMGGKAVQFGIDEEELPHALELVRANGDALAFRGVHIYVGSQCFDPAGVVAGVEDTIRIVGEIESSSGLACKVVNFGGGFGVSHVEADKELDRDELGQSLRGVLERFAAGSPTPRRIVFELGRYLTANAGLYVCRVISTKHSRGKDFVITDGGLHHHLAAAGTFGAALRSNFILRNVSRADAPPVKCMVAGPSCNPTDLLGVDVELARPEMGDLLAVLKSGSYGLTASPILFLGRRTPAELIRHAGKIALGRRSRPVSEFN